MPTILNNSTTLTSKKAYIIIGHLTYLILFILAGYFYIERVIYVDAAYYIFKMINFNSFNIEFGRYGSILYEFPSYIAMKLGLSLKTIIFLFSLQVVAVSYAAFALCMHYFKNYACAFTILFLNLIGVSSSFFFVMSELYIGLILCILLFAWLEKRNCFKFDFITIFIGAVLILAGFLSHPGVATVLLFLIGYYLIIQKNWTNINLYALLIIFLIVFIWKSIQAQQNAYESDIIAGIGNYNSFFKNFMKIPSVKYFFYEQINVYFIYHAIFIFLIIKLLIRKEFIKLAYFSLGYIGIMLLLLLLNDDSGPVECMEKALQPLTVFLFLPFLKEIFFNDDKKQILKIVFFIILIIVCFGNIYNASKRFKARILYIDNILHNADKAKSVLFYNTENRKIIMVDWAIGVETLLYSSLQGPENSKTVYLIEKYEFFDYSDRILNPDIFLSVNFDPFWSAGKLNKRYFSLPLESYSCPITDKASNVENIKPDKYYKIISVFSRKCLEVESNSEGAKLMQCECNNSDKQNFKFIEVKENNVFDKYMILNKSSNLYLDIYEGGLDEGVQVIQWYPKSVENQIFFLIWIEGINYNIMASNSKKVFDIPDRNLNDSVKVIQYKPNGQENQLFGIKPVD